MYLKDEQYYVDFYDLLTIKDCLDTIEFYSKPQKSTSELEKKMSPDEIKKGKTLVTNISIYYKKGERYKHKAPTIHDWMERDRRKDEFIANATEPTNIRCSHCGSKMKSTMKDLYDLDENIMRVLFFFECLACKKRKGIFDNGEEFNSGAKVCSQCSQELTITYTKEKNVVTRVRKCNNCSFSETEIDNYDAQDAEWKKTQQADRELLEKYRVSFCLTDKEGQEYVVSTEQAKRMIDFLKEREVIESNPHYQKAMQLKKLTIVEVERSLNDIAEKANYIKLSFDKPEVDKYIIVPFNIQDAYPSRKEYDSVRMLQKLIKSALEGTNWRLMSEGIHYRLGILTGRLKAYEREEDLVKLVR